MLINPFISCSARLPVYILIIGAFFQGNEVSILFLVYGIGIFFAIFFAVLFKKTIFKSEEAPFVMELPPYRLPTLKTTLKHMWNKGSQYVKKMGGVILIASIIIWALGYFPTNSSIKDEFNKKIINTEITFDLQLKDINTGSDEYNDLISTRTSEINKFNFEKSRLLQEKSFIGIIGKFIEPVMRPLGFDWKMSVSLLAGVAAKEVVVSTMGVLYQAEGDPDSPNETLQNKLQNSTYREGDKTGDPVFTPVTAFAYLMFILLYFPCVAVVAAVKKESGKWKWAIFMITYTTAVAWTVSFLVNQIGNLML